MNQKNNWIKIKCNYEGPTIVRFILMNKLKYDIELKYN